MMNFLKGLGSEEGATMIEYALMVALIGAACVAVVTTLGTTIAASFSSVTTTVGGGGS